MPDGGIRLTSKQKDDLSTFLTRVYHRWAERSTGKMTKTDIQDWARVYLHMPHTTISGIMRNLRNMGFSSARQIATAFWKNSDIRDWEEFCDIIDIVIMPDDAAAQRTIKRIASMSGKNKNIKPHDLLDIVQAFYSMDPRDRAGWMDDARLVNQQKGGKQEPAIETDITATENA